VAAAVGAGGPVSITVIEQRPHGILAAGGTAVNVDARKVHVRIFSRWCLNPGDAIGETGILEVFPANVMKGLGASVGAHTVDDNHNKFQFSHAPLVAIFRETFWNKLAVWASINVFDDRIILLGIKIRRSENNPVNVRFPVASLDGEGCGKEGVDFEQAGCITFTRRAD